MITSFSTGQVARLLGVPIHKLSYAHATGHLPEPSQRFLGKRCYTADEVQQAANYFGVDILDSGIKAVVK